MKGFFIKKAFFDGWDNLIGLVGMNLVYMVLLVVGFYAFGLGSVNIVLGYALAALVWLVACILMGGTAAAVKNYSDYRKEAFATIKSSIRRNLRHSLFYFAFTMIHFVMGFIVIPFYFMIDNPVSMVISVVLFWFVVIVLLAAPYYFALMCALPGDRPLKTFKKCFIILLDNTGFTIFFAVYNLICIALSVFTLGMVPGLSGMQLAAQDAIKLLMFKYDYIEANPDCDRKHLNWDDLLFDEKEKVGPRSLKSMIFPWKD